MITMENKSRRHILSTVPIVAVGSHLQFVQNSSQTRSEANSHTIYIGVNASSRGAAGVYAFNETGAIEWEFGADPEESSTVQLVNTAPTVVNGTVYFGFTSQFGGVSKVYAVDASTGEKKWEFREISDTESSPTVINDTVYIGSDNNIIYALDAETGDEKWNYETDSWVRSAPAVAGDHVFIGSWDSYLYALDASTGDRLWRAETGDRINSSPTAYCDRVYVISEDGNLYSFNAETGESQWIFDTDSHVRGSPTVYDQTVYIGSEDEYLYAIETHDGSMDWNVDLDGSVNTPTVADDVVYLGTNNGYIYSINPKNGEVIWEGPNNIEHEKFNTGVPTVVGERLYISAGAGLLSVDKDTGNAQWYEQLGISNRSAPTVVEDPDTGDSIGSRVNFGTLGHHHTWAEKANNNSCNDLPSDPSISDYTDSDSDAIQTDGLRKAINDWREDRIDTETLRDVIDHWRSS